MTRGGVAARVAVLLGAFLVLAPLQALAKGPARPIARRVPIWFHRLLLRLFAVRVTVAGTPPAGARPTLILSNHVSWLDIPIIGSLQPLSFIAKSEIARWPVVGTLARLQRCVFIDRGRKGATAEVNSTVADRLAAGDAIVLFAEGTTGDGNRLLPFRSSLVGAAQSVLSAGAETVLLQPLAITYTRRNGLPVTRRDRPAIAWYGDMDLFPHFGGFVRGGPLDAVVAWGEPIPFGPDSNRKEAAAAAEEAVRALRRAADG